MVYALRFMVYVIRNVVCGEGLCAHVRLMMCYVLCISCWMVYGVWCILCVVWWLVYAVCCDTPRFV